MDGYDFSFSAGFKTDRSLPFDSAAFDPAAFATYVEPNLTEFGGVSFDFYFEAVGIMGRTFPIKRGDTNPNMVVTILDPDGVPLDLTNASSVKVTAKGYVNGELTTIIDDVAMGVVDAANGKVQHFTLAAHTAVEGTFQVLFKITWNDATITRVPSQGYGHLEVEESL